MNARFQDFEHGITAIDSFFIRPGLAAIHLLAEALHRMLDDFAAPGRRERHAGERRHERLKAGIEEIMLRALQAHGCQLPLEEVSRLLGMDFELNAQGIGVWLDKLGKLDK